MAWPDPRLLVPGNETGSPHSGMAHVTVQEASWSNPIIRTRYGQNPGSGGQVRSRWWQALHHPGLWWVHLRVCCSPHLLSLLPVGEGTLGLPLPYLGAGWMFSGMAACSDTVHSAAGGPRGGVAEACAKSCVYCLHL